MSSRENIRVTGDSINELKQSLNFIFQRMSDRLDKAEGVRGEATVESNLNLSGNTIINVNGLEVDLTETISNVETDILTNAATIAAHVANVSNPHSVTAAQVGAPALVNPSTDNAVVRFNSTAGLQQNSGVTIDDSNNIDVPGDATVNGYDVLKLHLMG